MNLDAHNLPVERLQRPPVNNYAVAMTVNITLHVRAC